MNGSVRDAGLCLVLFLSVLVYLRLWPHDLYSYDEGLFLYEAKRVLDGEVMYRDFFDILTPGSHYLMASLYALFGVSMETARTGMAILHGAIAMLSYLICRRVGVRWAIAVATAIAYPAICHPALPIASAHWFGTGATLVTFLLVLCRATTTTRRSFALGLVTGVVIVVEQQRGTVIAAAGIAVLMMDHILEPASAAAARVPLRGKVAAYLGGLVIVALPVLMAFLAIAGFEPVFRALVRYPLDNYRRVVHDVQWGFYVPGSPGLGVLLKYLPLIVPVAASRAAWQWAAKLPPERCRPLLTAVVFSAFAILSIAYCPDSVHLALVGPVWLTLVAESLERLFERVEHKIGQPQALGTAAALLVMAGLGWQLHRAWRIESGIYRFPRNTAFGRIDFANPEELALLDALEPLLRNTGAREIFAYPTYASLYLLTATFNPTRYQIVLPGYTDPDQIEEIIAILEARQVPFVVRSFYWWKQRGDPLLPYLQQRYEPIRFPGQRPGIPTFALYRRKAGGPTGVDASS